MSIAERSTKEVHGKGGFNASYDFNLPNDVAKGTMKKIPTHRYILILKINLSVRLLL